ncbi:MAG: 2-oxoglutarate and iron-dependent oxygenase domain-containing protein [Pseudomonadota bacterium]
MNAEPNRTDITAATGLPVLNVSALRSGTARQRAQLAHKIGTAAREIGFFKIVGHGIDLDLIERTYQMAERFFALPEETKRALYIGLSTNHRGYVPFTEKGDYPDEKGRSYEAFDLALDLPHDDPDYLAGNQLLGPNVWPDLDGFRETITEYYTQVSVLGRAICGALEQYLGLPAGKITDNMTKPISQLRLLHYVRQRSVLNAKSVNMGAHTDYECLTLLHTRNPGLQVMDTAQAWIDVPADPGAFVVNIGDMLEAWSNGHLRSTPHRVLNLSDERYSLPYFVAANFDTVIAPFPEILRGDDVPLYEPFEAGAHLERMLVRDFPYLAHRAKKMTGSASVTNPFEARMNQAGS